MIDCIPLYIVQGLASFSSLHLEIDNVSIDIDSAKHNIEPTDQDSRSETLLWGRNIVLI